MSTNFNFDFSKAMFKYGGKWVNLTLNCECTKESNSLDITVTHNGTYLPWESLWLINNELCREIKESAKQVYEDTLEVEDDSIEMNLID